MVAASFRHGMTIDTESTEISTSLALNWKFHPLLAAKDVEIRAICCQWRHKHRGVG
jgi:hypothetical protein